MADKTQIEWTDATWNPIAGCSIVSPGCTNCYAMRQAARIERMGTAPHYAGLTREMNGKPVWTGQIGIASERALTAPLRMSKPRRIFVNSMSDLFHEAVPDEVIDRVFAVMALSPQHTFQVLTKRPERMRSYLATDRRDEWADAWSVGSLPIMRHEVHAWLSSKATPDQRWLHHAQRVAWPLPNVWLGVSIEDQRRADERVPILLDTPAAVLWISAEPLLGRIEFHNLPVGPGVRINALTGERIVSYGNGEGDYDPDGPRLDWVVAGGESGPGARPMHPDWARSLRDQCASAGVPFLFKQWGEWSPVTIEEDEDENLGPAYPMAGCADPTAHRAHQKCLFWQDDRLVSWPFVTETSAIGVRRVGKKAAGRTLDGVTHDAYPEVAHG